MLCLALAGLAQAEDFGVRLILGLGDAINTRWDGSVQASGATVRSVEPWRFEGDDRIDGNSWKCAIHAIRLFGAAPLGGRPAVANGVMVWLSGAGNGTSLEVTTAQGKLTVAASEIPFGKQAMLLGGRAMAERVPAVTQMTSSADEQDYPAAAVGPNGDVWVAYLEFKHHPEHNALRANLKTPPTGFDRWTTKAPGDQVFVKKYAAGRWWEPIAVSETGGDLYRPAIAVDGKGRAWVFWSANDASKGGANFDLFGRLVDGDRPGATVRLSTAAGSDVFPVAATDSTGRVHVAWQAWRDGRAQILAAVQNGDSFGHPVTVSATGSNEWNPAIAASRDGRVTVAYESYRNGSYDIFLRTYANGAWGKEIAAAASTTYEAYPSLAYEPSGRLWLAYEEGGEGWGKDFGADESSGVALYQGRTIRLRAWEPDGRVVEPSADIGAVLPGVADQRLDAKARQTGAEDFRKPKLDAWKTRDRSRPTPNFTAPRNNYPRVAVDASGRLWVAVRSNHPVAWNPLGTVWSEYVVSYDGAQWTGPVLLAHSDNLLDNRPAVVSTAPGEALVIGSSDHRMEFHRIRGVNNVAAIVDDPYNNDLYAHSIALSAGSGKLAVKASTAPSGGLSPAELAEKQNVLLMRDARVGNRYRIVRGEFHRHSEASADGGNDGSLLEQWRYMLDAAAMDWVGCCDHDNGGGREYSWWTNQKLTDMFYTAGKFVPMFSYERSVPYPEGHRNVVFAQRGVRTLPRLPITKEDLAGKAPDTQMLYQYLRKFNGVAASHTSGTNMGTDWRDNDPLTEPMVEIYQGDRQNYEMPGGPRSNSAEDSIGGWRPKGFVNLALEMGYKLAFQASSDHVSTHMSYCNVLATGLTREALLEGFQKRHVYGATDNISAEFRSGGNIMGDVFAVSKPPEFKVKLQGTAPFAKVVVVKDGKYVYSSEPKKAVVDFTWRDGEAAKGKQSYYYVRGEQTDGEVVWVSPMWITYK